MTSIQGDCTTWNETVQMEMVQEDLAPGVEDGNEAQGAAEAIFGVFAEQKQGFRCCFEQDIEDLFLIAQGNGVYLMGQGKDIVEIGHREQFSLASFKPPCLC